MTQRDEYGPYARKAGHLWPRIGWVPASETDALELGLPVRTRWQLFMVEWLGHGVALRVRPEPVAA